MEERKNTINPWIRIIIVNFNSGYYLQQCVDSLLKQTCEEYEAVIVDNASTDDSLTQLKAETPRIRIERSETNLGFATANNIGARDCRAPWIATLNPDTIPADNWLESLRRATVQFPNTAMFGSTQIMLSDPEILDGCGDVYSFLGIPWRGGYGHPRNAAADTGVAFSPCAAAALYARDAFVEAGGFDESFFCYLEDIDLGFRLRLMGEHCIQVHDAVVRHEGSATSGRRSHFTLFHSARNRVWVILKNMPASLLILLLPLHILATAWLLLRVHDRDWRQATLTGIRSGLANFGEIMKSRSAVQHVRRISALEIAKAFNWNINDLRQRRPDIRPIHQYAIVDREPAEMPR